MTDSAVGREAPQVFLASLDTVWFQVAGTICNLRCTHCFISCSPDNHSHEMMSLSQVRAGLREAERLGVREYYFTGGEPFMNRDLMQMLEETLRIGPAVVLTNGLFLDTRCCRKLSALADASEYSFDLRISLDGWQADDHDRIRGRGTWARTIEGIGRLCEAGLNPVITVTEAAEGVGSSHGRAGFLERLRGIGLHRPRLKILPIWKIGAEVERRGGGYEPWERLTADRVDAAGIARLQCAAGRMITSRGVYVCPILIDEPRARMGATLAETLRPFSLDHGACHTCYVTGVTCRN